jgi:hypothetical protein
MFFTHYQPTVLETKTKQIVWRKKVIEIIPMVYDHQRVLALSKIDIWKIKGKNQPCRTMSTRWYLLQPM